MASVLSSSINQADDIIRKIPKELDALNEYITTKLSTNGEEVRKASAKLVKSSKMNKPLRDLINEVRNALNKYIDELFVLERWIGTCVTKIADGNNFGADVQNYALKRVATARDELTKAIDLFPDYFSTRGNAMEKVIATKEVETVTKSENNSDTQGKKEEENGSKKVTSSNNEVKVTTTKTIPEDLVEHVAALDVKMYYTLRRVCQSTINQMAGVHLTLTQNRAKIEKPRGDNGGMRMY